MRNNPYIRDVLDELVSMGYSNEDAWSALVSHYQLVRRIWGFEPNATDFAKEISRLHELPLP